MANDARGDTLAVGQRVFVRPRATRYGELPGYGALVEGVHEDRLELRELGTFHSRDARPGQVAIQQGPQAVENVRRQVLGLERPAAKPTGLHRHFELALAHQDDMRPRKRRGLAR